MSSLTSADITAIVFAVVVVMVITVAVVVCCAKKKWNHWRKQRVAERYRVHRRICGGDDDGVEGGMDRVAVGRGGGASKRVLFHERGGGEGMTSPAVALRAEDDHMSPLRRQYVRTLWHHVFLGGAEDIQEGGATKRRDPLANWRDTPTTNTDAGRLLAPYFEMATLPTAFAMELLGLKVKAISKIVEMQRKAAANPSAVVTSKSTPPMPGSSAPSAVVHQGLLSLSPDVCSPPVGLRPAGAMLVADHLAFSNETSSSSSSSPAVATWDEKRCMLDVTASSWVVRATRRDFVNDFLLPQRRQLTARYCEMAMQHVVSWSRVADSFRMSRRTGNSPNTTHSNDDEDEFGDDNFTARSGNGNVMGRRRGPPLFEADGVAALSFHVDGGHAALWCVGYLPQGDVVRCECAVLFSLERYLLTLASREWVDALEQTCRHSVGSSAAAVPPAVAAALAEGRRRLLADTESIVTQSMTRLLERDSGHLLAALQSVAQGATSPVAPSVKQLHTLPLPMPRFATSRLSSTAALALGRPPPHTDDGRRHDDVAAGLSSGDEAAASVVQLHQAAIRLMMLPRAATCFHLGAAAPGAGSQMSPGKEWVRCRKRVPHRLATTTVDNLLVPHRVAVEFDASR